jgi:serine/threonine protein kinase
MPPTDLEAGVRIDDFRVEGRVGVGGMGIVYRARQLSLDRVVALKVLGGALTHPADVARFRRAAQAAAKLRHPNITAVYYVGQDDALCYVAMEYVDGVSLQQIVSAIAASTAPVPSLDAALTGPAAAAIATRFDDPNATADVDPAVLAPGHLTPAAAALIVDPAYHRRCCEVVRDAARALDHAHREGVIHRDVKPGNLMLDRAGQVRVIDFGLARFFDDATVTQTGQLIGTPMYMSPEQVTGRLELTGKTDVYSLGLVLYELLTLRPPVAAANREDLLRRIVTKPLASVAKRNRSIPPDLAAVIHQATAKDPDDRYATAGAFADDLQRFLDGKPVTAAPYRWKADEAEITAARPPYLVFLAASHIAVALLLLLIAIVMVGFVIDQVVQGSELDEWDLTVARLTFCCAVVSFPTFLLIGGGVLKGARWSLWAGLVGQAAMVLLMALGLNDVFSDEELAAGTRVVMALFLSMIGIHSGITVWLLARKRTRAWFALAARLRAEQAAPD